MKKIFYFMPILLFYFTTQVKAQVANNTIFQEQFKSGMLYVTATPDAILQLVGDNNLYSTRPELNQLIQDWNIIDFKIAFPSSQVLTNVYQMQCICNEDSLLQAVYDLPQYYTIPEKVAIPQLLYTPNDYSLVFANDYALNLINAQDAWDITTGDPSVIIGITDANYHLSHEELVGKYTYVSPNSSTDFVHGTAVAITAAGNTDNGVGKSSIGFNSMLQLRVMSYNEVLEASYSGARIVNMSWAAGCTFNSYAQEIINEAHANGTVLVAAAGNGGTCGGAQNLVYPAAFNHVIAVSSVGPYDNHERTIGNPSTTHQHNSSVDLCAPGYDVALSIGPGSYMTGNGSSFAAPMVSGTAGLILSENPNFTPDEVEQILKCTADDIYSISYNSLYTGLLGAGRLNAGEALKMARNYTSPILEASTACANGGTGSITMIGNGNYSFLWSTGETGENVSGLTEGDTYSVTITHQCGFSKTLEIDFEFEILPAINISESHLNTIGCQGNGSIDLTVSGGTSPYTYSWNNGSTSEDLDDLSSGLYEVLVTDINNCSELLNITVELIPANFITIGNHVNSTCFEGNGSINLTVSGGTPPYSFLWNNGETTGGINDLTAGFYEVLITDNNNCLTSYNGFILQDDGIYDYPNGLIITSPGQQIQDLVPDGIIRIRGTLIIKSSVNYSISNKTLEFARDLLPEVPDQGATHSGVIIEQNAKLTATNCTFKGISSCNAMWQGIQVWGDDFKPSKGKPLAPVNSLQHGELILNNCTVRDAHIGVALYRVNAPFIINPLDHGRGILKAKFSTFLNNRISVDFKGRSLVTNSSYIKECNFICNQAMIDPLIYNGEGSDVFIRLSKVKNPVINGNTFNGNLAFTIDKRATGIRSYDAGYIVQSGNAGAVNPTSPPVPNKFNNLSQGIDVYSTGGAVNTIKIKDNRYDNVYQGITANGSNFDEISYNVFKIPAGDVAFNSWGMFMQTSSGFLATENTFNTLGTNTYTFGLVSRNVNLVNGEVYKNNFGGSFNSATQAEGTTNNKLQIDCNRYLGNNTYDWTVLSGSLADQGICLPNATAPTTNIFNECVVANESNIFSITSFLYSTDPDFAPDCNSATVLLEQCIVPVGSYNNACPQIVSSSCPQCVIALGIELGNTPPGLGRDKIKGELIRSLAQDGDVQQLINVLTSEGLPEDKKIIIPTRIIRKEFNEARQELNSLDILTVEDQKFAELFDVLITLGETERVLEDITLAEKTVIENVSYSMTEVAVQAEAVLAELNKTRYIRFPQEIPNSSAMMLSSSNDEGEITESIKSHVSVYPNPSDGDVMVQFEEPKSATGYLIDAMGRIVETFTFGETETIYEVKGLARGIYTIGIYYTDGTSDSKRVLIK